MSALRVRCLTITALVGAAILHAETSSAATKDAEALELAKKAIYGDYLGTKFADAEKKLNQALSLCQPKDACSAKVKAQLRCDLGIVYVGGMNRPDDGKAQFAAALKDDPSVVPEPDLVSPEIEAAFAEVKRGGGKGVPPPPPVAPPVAPPSAGRGDLVHTPPAEQATLTPVPLYVELPPGQTAARVQVSYKPFGAPEWKSVEMKPAGKGYAAELPCADVGSATGDLSYYVQAFDGTQNMVSWSGSRAEPNKVPIRASIQGEAPHLPGQPPPARCPDIGDCPPEFPGCHAKENEPPPCEPGAECAPDPKLAAKKNWLSLAVQQDFLVLGGSKATCAGSNEYSCFDGGGKYYDGIPYAKSGDELRGGLSAATTRILAGYDRAIGSFSVGARVGFAFRGGPQAPGGKSFFPFHGEVRGAYWFGKDPWVRTGPRPYLVVGGGVMQVDGSANVVVYQNAADYANDTRTSLAAWKKSGIGFATGGLGMLFAVTPRMGPFLELKFMQLFGSSGSALNLQIGYALGL